MSIASMPTIPLGIGWVLYLLVVGSVIRIPRISKGQRKRFTREQRVKSIYGRIYESTARNRPLTVSQIARAEHISKSWAYHYVRIIRRRQRKRGILIHSRRFGKKRFLVYENLRVKEAGFVRQRRGAWELHGSTR